LEEEGRGLVGLVPELGAFCPPARVIDKPVYSPWYDRRLRTLLHEDDCDTVIISGGETDVCVLSTVLGAIDWGYRTILIEDAVCSVSDEAHDAILKLFHTRYSQHVETASTEEVLSALH
jgi:nicotinamidase-related amidase